MKAVYRSIKPYWLYLILIGEKTVEVGKTFPKADDWNKEVFLHCSKDMKSFKRIPEKDREWMRKYLGKVACRFVCEDITDIHYHEAADGYSVAMSHPLCDFFAESTCLKYEELHKYLQGNNGYGWHISDLVIYDKPRELSEFYNFCNGLCFDNSIKHRCIMFNPDSPYVCDHIKPLKRPPQSWCYVEVPG